MEIRRSTIIIILSCTLSSCTATPLLAQVEPSKVLIGIVGEAEGCSLMEQEAIGRAILNRGSLRGVYGFERARRLIIPKLALNQAKMALNRASSRDLTGGATHWLSNWDLKHCRESLIAWRHKMRVTLRTKHFTFYKEAK